MRPDKVKRHIKKFDDGFGDMVVGMMVLVIGKPNAPVVGEMDGDSHTVFLPSIIEPPTFRGLGHGQP